MSAPMPPVDIAHIHHSESPCSAAIKTPEGICWSKAFEVFSSRPVCNARVVLTTKAEQPRAYPTAKVSPVDLPSRRERSGVRKEELWVLDPALRTNSWSLVEKDIRKTLGWGPLQLPTALKQGISSLLQSFRRKEPSLVSCMDHHRMVYTLHSDRSRAGEARHLQVRCWRTRNHDAWDVPLANSRSTRGGSLHCTFWNLWRMPNPPQGLNKPPKALTQGLGLCLGSQTSAGVVPFNL